MFLHIKVQHSSAGLVGLPVIKHHKLARFNDSGLLSHRSLEAGKSETLVGRVGSFLGCGDGSGPSPWLRDGPFLPGSLHITLCLSLSPGPLSGRTSALLDEGHPNDLSLITATPFPDWVVLWGTGG